MQNGFFFEGCKMSKSYVHLLLCMLDLMSMQIKKLNVTRGAYEETHTKKE